MNKKFERALSTTATIIIAVVVIVAVVAGVVAVVMSHKPTPTTVTTTVVTTTSSVVTSTVTTTTTTVSTTTPTTTTPTTTTTTMAVTISPPNTSQLVDVSQEAAPDALDPATGFYVQDGPLFSAIYQELVEFNGSNYLQVVPVVAENWSTTNYQNWTFYIRQGVYFSDGVQVNASTVWFSFYRMILMGQGPGVANYPGLLFSITQYSATGYAIPWGVANALAQYLHVNASNATAVAYALASILSHFNANNKTIQEIMSYPYQAVVVKGPYQVQMNTMVPYRDFLLDIASWWGAIQDPVFVDAHGGVQPNTPNSYINLHGMPGTGPYEISYVAQGFSEIKLVANPNYWGKNIPNIPAVAEPAHIPVIIIYYGLSHTDRVEDFGGNTAQISYVDVPFIGQMYSSYKYKGIPLSAIFKNYGAEPGVLYISMNTEVFPTNITAFRLALVYAVNYSALLHIFSYNGTILAEEFLGPISPQFPIYNEVMAMDHLQPYTYNLSLALHYLNEAGYEAHFYVVLPNGTVIGDPSGTQLPTLAIYTIAPITPLEQEELEIITNDLQQIGISITVRLVTPSVVDSWLSPQSTPAFTDVAWFPDWSDPIYQQLVVQTDVEYGGIAGNFAWVNVSWINNVEAYLPFMTNTTNQTILVAKIYAFLYNYAPYIDLPVPATYFFVQPYLQGFVYNPFSGYWYNMMYYAVYNYTA